MPSMHDGTGCHADGRASFQPVSLNSFSQWGLQPHAESMAHGRSVPITRPPSRGPAPGVQMQPNGMPSNGYGCAHPSQPPGSLNLLGSDDGSMGGRRDSRGGEGPPAWQHSGAATHGQSAPGGYIASQSARMLQQITAPSGYSGPAQPQMMYGVPQQPASNFNAMYIGVQPAYGHEHGGAPSGSQPWGSPYAPERMVQMRGPPEAAPGMAGREVHEGTQRGGTALRKLQNVPQGAARPVMLRATPMGRTAPRRPGVLPAPAAAERVCCVLCAMR